MQRATQQEDPSVRDLIVGQEDGDDLRRAMMRIDARIEDYERAGEEVPKRLLRLSRAVAAACAALSQGR